MPPRFQCILSSILVCLLVTNVQAEAPRFARGLLIYKSVQSDTPVYYDGVLFISSSAVAIWKEYDVGQPKPFRITNNLVVAEINFGALFEADFTTDKHLEFCKNIQSQLNAAAKQSPKLANVTKAANNAIQTQINQYEQFKVRFRGEWVKRSAYFEILQGEENARLAQIKAREDQERVNQAEAMAYQRALAEAQAERRAMEEAERIKEAAEMAALEVEKKRQAALTPPMVVSIPPTVKADEMQRHLPTDRRLNSGSILVDNLQGLGGKGKLTLDNGLAEDAFVKMINGEKLVASFYVRGGERFTFDHAPDGFYKIIYCTGFGWNDGRRDFARGRHAVRYDKVLNYTTTLRTEGNTIITSIDVMTLTLHKTPYGNTQTSDIPLEEFDRY